MKKITEIILDYINNPRTNHALLVNGEWGSGKTYFFTNNVIKEIEKIIIDGKKLKVIYVSLNGLSSIDEIYTQIAADKYLGTKSSKIGLGVVNSLANIVNVNLKENFKIENFLSFSNNVIIFDDLERISTKIKIADVLGFVNTNFVEHNRIKTIIIANEDEFKNKKEGKYYAQIKEKLIGRTLSYEPNLNIVIPQIIRIFENKDNKKYYSFLKKNSDEIIRLCKQFSIKNLRTIIFSLEILEKIFVSNKKLGLSIHGSKLLLFCFTVSNEFKLGTIQSKDYPNTNGLEFIDKNYHMSYMSYMLSKALPVDSSDEIEKSDKFAKYANNFFKKYLQNSINEYFFFHSIYKYILTGEFDNRLFHKEYILIPKEELSPEIEIQQNIYDFRNLKEEEFTAILPKFIEYVKNGKYNFYTYPSLFSYLKYFKDHKLLNIKSDELHELINQGLQNIDNQTSTSSNELDRIRHFSSNDPDTKSVEEKVFAIHQKLMIDETKKKLEDIISLTEHEKDLTDFFKNVLYKPIFNVIDIDNFYTALINASNKTLTQLYFQIDSRYNSSNLKQFYHEEHENLLELKSKLEKFLEEQDNSTIKGYHISNIAKKIDDTLTKME